MDNTATQYIQILYYEALWRYMMDSSCCAHPSAWKAVSKAFATPRCHGLEDKARHKAQRASRSTLVWSKLDQWLNAYSFVMVENNDMHMEARTPYL